MQSPPFSLLFRIPLSTSPSPILTGPSVGHPPSSSAWPIHADPPRDPRVGRVEPPSRHQTGAVCHPHPPWWSLPWIPPPLPQEPPSPTCLGKSLEDKCANNNPQPANHHLPYIWRTAPVMSGFLLRALGVSLGVHIYSRSPCACQDALWGGLRGFEVAETDLGVRLS